MVGDITLENVSYLPWFAQGCVQGIGLEDKKDYCYSGRKWSGKIDFDFCCYSIFIPYRRVASRIGDYAILCK